MKRNAFTLMELMLVVIVIAVLVSIAIPNYINTVERAKAREARATLASMRAAEMTYDAERRTKISLGANDSDWEAVGLENPNSNPDRNWNYAFDGASGDGTATRTSGPYSGDTVTLADDGTEGGSGFYVP